MITSTLKVSIRKLETRMRSMLTNELIEKLWQLRDNKQYKMALLENIRKAHNQLEQ